MEVHLRFFVKGRPVPQPRPQFTRRNKRPRSNNDRVAKWKALVKRLGHEEMGGQVPVVGPVFVELHFRFQRAKCHVTGKGELRASAPLTHCQTPDADNLAKSVLDGLNKVVWGDDCQVVSLMVTKAWAGLGEDQGCEVLIGAAPESGASSY